MLLAAFLGSVLPWQRMMCWWVSTLFVYATVVTCNVYHNVLAAQCGNDLELATHSFLWRPSCKKLQFQNRRDLPAVPPGVTYRRCAFPWRRGAAGAPAAGRSAAPRWPSAAAVARAECMRASVDLVETDTVRTCTLLSHLKKLVPSPKASWALQLVLRVHARELPRYVPVMDPEACMYSRQQSPVMARRRAGELCTLCIHA